MTTKLKAVLFQKMIFAILVSHSGYSIAAVDGTTGVASANCLYTKITNHISSNRRIYGTVLGVVATIIIGKKISPKINQFNTARRLQLLKNAGFGKYAEEFAEKYPSSAATQVMVRLKEAGCNKASEMHGMMDQFMAGKTSQSQIDKWVREYRKGI